MSVPYAPQNVVLQTGNQKNLLSWDITVGATGYSISRSTDGLNFSSLGTSVAPSYLDSAVSVGVEYWYQVQATNSSGLSVSSKSYPESIVPALPGRISLKYLRYQSQLMADKLNSQYLTLDEWNFNINQAVKELADLLTTKYGEDYFMAPKLLIPLTGLDRYPLPDGSNYDGAPAIYKLLGVDVNISGGSATGSNASWFALPRFNWSDRDKYTTYPNQAGALNNLFMMGYREMGSNIEIIPSNSGQTMRLSYVPIKDDLLQDTDMLDFSYSGWSELVIVIAAMKAMVKEESLEKWNALAAQKSALISRIEDAASNRDAGQPNSVSNVRATMGDMGFGGSGGNGYWGGGFGGSGGSF